MCFCVRALCGRTGHYHVFSCLSCVCTPQVVVALQSARACVYFDQDAFSFDSHADESSGHAMIESSRCLWITPSSLWSNGNSAYSFYLFYIFSHFNAAITEMHVVGISSLCNHQTKSSVFIYNLRGLVYRSHIKGQKLSLGSLFPIKPNMLNK